jgi:hypothetical protein
MILQVRLTVIDRHEVQYWTFAFFTRCTQVQTWMYPVVSREQSIPQSKATRLQGPHALILHFAPIYSYSCYGCGPPSWIRFLQISTINTRMWTDPAQKLFHPYFNWPPYHEEVFMTKEVPMPKAHQRVALNYLIDYLWLNVELSKILRLQQEHPCGTAAVKIVSFQSNKNKPFHQVDNNILKKLYGTKKDSPVSIIVLEWHLRHIALCSSLTSVAHHRQLFILDGIYHFSLHSDFGSSGQFRKEKPPAIHRSRCGAEES